MYFTSDDGSQNMFVYQPTLDTLDLKKGKGIDYVIDWKSRGLYTFTSLYTTFLHCRKLSGYRIGIKFDNSVLVVEENNYASKIVNAYIVYDLDTWPKHPLNNFTFKNSLFGATNIVKNNVKQKFVYSGYGIAFDGNGEQIFGYEFVEML